ncbi:alpha/beta fold hydrolase [Mesotoga sp. UBA5825]|uniref:alpha/beta fold hydrolase n=1 Tax=Mesotoga sp. UBA5825 TaxID=1946858 RepID=UPI0025E7B819|nr:alpha/beta fold hydrolase [Mesotoga sp. UBA5825]
MIVLKVTRRASLAVVLVLLLGTMLLAAGTEYTVVKGDTLWEIAKTYDVDWKEIAELNGITDEFALQVGTVLKIPAAYTEISVMIPNIDHDIPAVICIPKGDGPFPIVVMLHGTGSDKSEAGGGYLLAAPALAEAGIASIRFDFIGNGESTADYIDYNFTSAVDDTNIAFAYAASLPRIDGHRAGVMGWSQGGTIALLAAGQNPAYKSVLCWAGAPDLSGVADLEAYEIAKENGFYELTFEWRSSLKLGLQWFDEAYGTDVLQVFSNSTAPVLAINGALDTVVDPVNAQRIVDASRNNESEVLLIEGADHTFNIFTGDMTAFDQLIGATVDWFVKTL